MHSYDQYKTAYEALLKDVDRLYEMTLEGESYELITHYIQNAWQQANQVRQLDAIIDAARGIRK